jgi:hypothetical protein
MTARYLFQDDAKTGDRATAIDDTGRMYELIVLDVGRCDGVVGMLDVEVIAQGCAWRGTIDVFTDAADEREAALLIVPEWGEGWQRHLRTFIVDGAR